MKVVAFAFVALFSFTASAAELSPELKSEILKVLAERCDADNVVGIDVEGVSISEQNVDQGVTDQLVVAHMKALERIAGSDNLLQTNVSVEASISSISNPGINPIRILRLRSDLCFNDIK